MARFNGHIVTFTKGSSTGGENAVLTGISASGAISDAVPAKHFRDAIFGVVTQGISGTYACHVVGAVGGATMVIAGQTGIAADGSSIIGTTTPIAAIPRPAYVSFDSAEDGAGFTASVFMAAEY